MTIRDGMFRIPRPERSLEFTGERLTSAMSGGVEMEHLHRYAFARDFCVGKDVLDVAAGEGYGSAMLAGVARHVIGVEIDAASVEHARRAYATDNLAYEAGDALDLPLPDASRDIVVSFETLEHLRDQARFIAEVRRVLRPGGLLIISTPDRLVHSGLGMPVNPHHVLELSRDEFDAMLRDSFAHHRILAQRTLAGSLLLDDGGDAVRPRSYERRSEAVIEATSGVARAVYLLGLASDGPLPPVPASFYADRASVDMLIAAAGQAQAEVARVEGEVARLEAEASALQQALAAAADRQREVEANRQAAEERLREAEARRQEVEALWQEAESRVVEALEDAAAQRQAVAAALRDRGSLATRAEAERDQLAARLADLHRSLGVRLGLYAVHNVYKLPTPLLRLARGSFRRAVRLRARLKGQPPVAMLAPSPAEPAPPQAAPPAAPVPAQPVTTARGLIAATFPWLQPIACFPVPAGRRRVSVVTDSIGPSNLFGGVGTALLLGALVADRLGASLRIVTRTEPAEAGPVRDVLESNGIALGGPLELAFAPLDGSQDLPLAPDDVFLTTSWWTTRATLGTVDRARVAAIVQEDERMFYPFGDERMRCAETLAEPGILTVVNTEMLFKHLTGVAPRLTNIEENGTWFEPAFPGAPAPAARTGKRRFFFYARPNNLRNLFWRGLEALDAAAGAGLFPAEEWEMYWVGKDIPEVVLARGIQPLRRGSMGWGAYHAFIASMDAGLVLMDTPHPSYPPLDLAAAGAAVLTNTHPGKESLSHYSDNILVARPTVDGLVEGLHRLQALALDDALRARHRAGDRIRRDWSEALEPAVARLATHFGKV